ncbi:MAG: NUDIX domain-containing protein [Deltaproteobacteria bacterium]|nr:NUDIX domain-containing protein [Deltaproteobacteria bacterium]
MDELFPLVNEQGEVVGSALRSEVHGNPALMHPVVHCIVVNARGELLLQLRSKDKDVQPGRWDTSVGGHVAFGEPIEHALARELREEIGLAQADLRFLYRYVMRSEIETELVHTYQCVAEGPFEHQVSEIDELRFWSREQIRAALGTGVLTPNFEDEFARYERTLR